MTSTHNPIEYALGRTTGEYERIIRQAKLFELTTRHLFEDAGLGPGMRVLDLGSGVGDVAFLAAEFVGTRGKVIGVDADEAAVVFARQRANAEGVANVQFFAADLRNFPPPTPVDAIVGRFVLMYQPDPAAALKALVAHLKPGGIVALYEPAFFPPPPGGLHSKAGTWIQATLQRCGTHILLGMQLHMLFRAAGLTWPKMRLEAIMDAGPDSPLYDYIADTVRSMLPKIIEHGIATAEEVQIETLAERLREEALRTHAPSVIAPHVVGWGRKESA